MSMPLLPEDMADDAMFDINCTKDGTALNDGSADLQSLTDSGVELMKPENGVVMTISVDGAEETAMEEANGTYTFGAAGDNEPTENRLCRKRRLSSASMGKQNPGTGGLKRKHTGILCFLMSIPGALPSP